MNETVGFRKKRKNETDAEFKSRVKRDEAARPAAAARTEQYVKDEARRMATPGYVRPRTEAVTGAFRKKEQPKK